MIGWAGCLMSDSERMCESSSTRFILYYSSQVVLEEYPRTILAYIERAADT